MNAKEKKCADCAQDDVANTQTCKKGCSKIKLFGVQIGVSTDDGGAAASSPIRKTKSTGDLLEAAAAAAAAVAADEEQSGYLSDGIVHQYSKSHERKRGKPWSEAEHRSFLEGLEKLGKGDWKGISTKFVPSRKSSQVASHAQKYFNRLNLKTANKKRRRGSVFDIALPQNTNQPLQSNNGDESLHIATTTSAAASKNVGKFKATTSAAASKNVGEFKPSTSAHVTTSEKPPLSPRKQSAVTPNYFFYEPRISWVPVVSYPRQNGGFVRNNNGRFAAVMPERYDDVFRQEWYFAPPNSTTNNDELLNIRNLTL